MKFVSGDELQIQFKFNLPDRIYRGVNGVSRETTKVSTHNFCTGSICQSACVCYDGRGIVRPETMARGTFLSLQTLHHDTSLRDIDYCYILSVTLMAFLRNQLLLLALDH